MDAGGQQKKGHIRYVTLLKYYKKMVPKAGLEAARCREYQRFTG
jgi:hypothetical protein